MMKREFEERIGKEISNERYADVEFIYMNYPVDLTKDDIAAIYKIGGMTLISDMMPKAKAKAEKEKEIRELERKIAELNEQIAKLNRYED